MWVLFLCASLLIRAIVGNLEIEGNNIRGLSKFNSEGRSGSGNQSKYVTIDSSAAWKDKTITGRSNEKRNVANDLEMSKSRSRSVNGNGIEGMTQDDAKARIGEISKRSQILPATSWLYSALENKIPSIEDYRGWSMEGKGGKRSSAFNPWAGKRITLYTTETGIRRPIRVPFNSWGGKRGNEIVTMSNESREKKSKDDLDRDEEQRILLEGYGVKRVADGGNTRWKTPFNSWGGKRSQISNNLSQRKLMIIIEKQVDPLTENTIGDFSKSQNVEDTIKKKRRSGMKNLNGRLRFNSWGGKRNEVDYQSLSPLSNETGNDYTTENEIDESNWIEPTPDKRSEEGQFRRTSFNPWGGKRNDESYEFHLADDYSNIPAESAKNRKVFFPWGG